MSNLSANWITENLVDFEYKKYLLLGYLKDVKQRFSDKKLYPDLAELIAHYRNLVLLKKNTGSLQSNFRKNINGIDLNTLKFNYENITDEDWLNEIKLIIEFSLPLMAEEVNEGKSIFDFVEKHILFDHIGILPINKKEGYFLLNPYDSRQIAVYSYNLSSITFNEQQHYGLNTALAGSYMLSLSKPVDKIKQDIIYNNPTLPNPAVFLFKAKSAFPNEETFFPVAKRMLFNVITTS